VIAGEFSYRSSMGQWMKMLPTVSFGGVEKSQLLCESTQ
jgi:hypothetical protein